MWPQPFTSPMTFSKSNFEKHYLNYCQSGWYVTKMEKINWILGQLCDLANGHTQDLDLEFQDKIKIWVWSSLISGMGGTVGMERKGCKSNFPNHYRDHNGVGVCTALWLGDSIRQRVSNTFSLYQDYGKLQDRTQYNGVVTKRLSIKIPHPDILFGNLHGPNCESRSG